MPNTYYPPPDPSAVYYRREGKNGEQDIASIQSLQKFPNGAWKALFLVPGQAPFYINQSSSELKAWEPVFALTEDTLDAVIERIAQRVTALLQEQGADSAADIVTKAMEVISKDTIEEAFEVAVGATTLEEDNGEGEFFIDGSFKKQKKQFKCGVCKKTYAYHKALQTHMKKEHDALSN